MWQHIFTKNKILPTYFLSVSNTIINYDNKPLQIILPDAGTSAFLHYNNTTIIDALLLVLGAKCFYIYYALSNQEKYICRG